MAMYCVFSAGILVGMLLRDYSRREWEKHNGRLR